jgi:hypothetical protein
MTAVHGFRDARKIASATHTVRRRYANERPFGLLPKIINVSQRLLRVAA